MDLPTSLLAIVGSPGLLLTRPFVSTPITNDHLVALGRITVEYAGVEHFLSSFIWILVADDPRVGQTITATLGFRARAELLRALFHRLPSHDIPANVNRLDAVVTLAENAVQKRN